MNIFNIFSKGDQKINEPAVTAVLNYMIDSNYDHGLGSVILDYLDDQVGIQKNTNKKSSSMDVEIELEEILYGENRKRRDSDISIYCFKKEKKSERRIENLKRVYCIENKITNSSLNDDQMNAIP